MTLTIADLAPQPVVNDIPTAVEWSTEPDPETWRDAAPCRRMGPALFYDDTREDDAREVCARCAVSNECRDYAIATRQTHGMWGGLNTRGLRYARLRRARAAARLAVR